MTTKKEKPKSKKSCKNDDVKQLVAELWDEIIEIQKEQLSLRNHVIEMNKQIKVLATRQGVPYDL